MPEKRVIGNTKGYSLVELIVVIAIMAILTASSTTVYTGYIKKAKTAEALAQCRAVYVAAETYFIEYSGSFDGSEEDLEEMTEELCELTHLDVEVLEDSDEYFQAEGNYGVVVKKKSGKWICEEILCDVRGAVRSFDTESGEFLEIN